MATYRVTHYLTGYINGQEWPRVGETIDLGDADVSGMVEVGHLEPVEDAPKKEKVEKRPAAKKAEEKR